MLILHLSVLGIKTFFLENHCKMPEAMPGSSNSAHSSCM